MDFLLITEIVDSMKISRGNLLYISACVVKTDQDTMGEEWHRLAKWFEGQAVPFPKD